MAHTMAAMIMVLLSIHVVGGCIPPLTLIM